MPVRQQLGPWLIAVGAILAVLIYGRPLLALAATNIANTTLVHTLMVAPATIGPGTCDTAALQLWPNGLLHWSQSLDVTQSTTYLALGRSALSAGCHNEAINWLNRALAQPMAAYTLGRIYEADGNITEAVRAYQHIPVMAIACIREGHAAASQQNWALARYKFKLAVQIAPENPSAHYALGEDLLYNPPQDLAAGIDELQDAIRLGYPNSYAYSRIAHGYAMSGRYADAIAILDRSQQYNPLANAVRGDAYLAQGDLARAVTAYQASLSQEPDNPWVNTSLGQAYWESGEHDRAIQIWQHTLIISPGFAPALGALAKVGQP